MTLKQKTLLIIAVSLLTACSGDALIKPQSWARAVQTAESRDAHLRLVNHYEEIAGTLEADAQEEREMLDQYLAKPWKYGKRIQDLKSQAEAMIRDLGKAAAESRHLADYHRQMAAEERD